MKTLGRFLQRQLRARPLAVLSLCFLAGVLIAGRWQLPVRRGFAAWAACFGASRLLRPGARRRVTGIMLVGVALLAGMLRMQLALDAVPQVRTMYSMPMVGRIVSEPFTNPKTGRVISKFRLETLGDRPSKLCLRLYLRGDEAPLAEIDYGQRLSLTGHIWANDPVTNPHEFDFGAYLREDGMSAMATAKIEDVTVLETKTNLRSHAIAARKALMKRIDALFPAHAPLVNALLLGDRSQLSEEQREAFRESGTAHLISISGLHVTVLAGALAALLGLFLNRRIAAVLAALLLVPYGAVIGFPPAFVRALMMFAVYSLAPVAGLPSDGITRLGAAMLVYLMIDPLAVTDAGFVLSYGATAGLILLVPPLEKLLRLDRLRLKIPKHPKPLEALHLRFPLYLGEVLAASLAAQLAILPGVIAFFGVQPLLSLPFNLFCVPLCMVGYLLALAAVGASFLWLPAARLVARGAEALFGPMLAVTRLSDRLPVAGVRLGRYPLALVLVHGAIVVAASELSRLKPRLRRVLPLALVLVAGISSLWTFARNWPFRIVFLDAGQADCAVVTTHGHTWLIDTGDTYTPVADYLSATALSLDGVFLSHPHQDHAGGLMDVLNAFTPDVVYVPAGWFGVESVAPAVSEGIERARDMGIEIRELAAGDAVPLSGEALLTAYNPVPGRAVEDVNDLSTLALIEVNGHTALFTGDLTIDGEPEVVPDTEVLKVAHHGADNATSQRFLRACTPEIAVVSVGENSFGHPAPETLRFLADIGAETFLTRDRGAVTLTLRGDAWRVQTYLEATP